MNINFRSEFIKTLRDIRIMDVKRYHDVTGIIFKNKSDFFINFANTISRFYNDLYKENQYYHTSTDSNIKVIKENFENQLVIQLDTETISNLTNGEKAQLEQFFEKVLFLDKY